MTDLLPLVDRDRTLAARQRMVLDTSVLIADPMCVVPFADVDVVVPLTVIEELDGLKTRLDDVGCAAARPALRAIEELRVRHGGSLAEPVPVGDGTIRIEINGVQKHLLVEHGLDPELRTTASSAPPSDRPSEVRRSSCPTTRRCASRPPTSVVAAMEHQPSRRA